MPNRKSYHFSIGNSTDGPIGSCARITAPSKAQAVERLRSLLNYQDVIYEDADEYLDAYFNPDAISTADIDEWEYTP